jgi:hypothetical protein
MRCRIRFGLGHELTGGTTMSDDAHTLAQEAVVVSAFRNGVAVNDIATVIGKTPEAVERMLGKAGLKVVDHQKPQPQPGESAAEPDEDAADTGKVRSFVAGDLAFQNAMYRAIKRGLEKPPLIGVFKDNTPLDFHRHYYRAQDHSGCSSPARDCAELSALSGKVAV